MALRVLSGGAAQALVGALAARFKTETGLDIDGSFGAVGGMKARVLNGEPADLVILTQALISELADGGHIDPASVRDIGSVLTAVAVRAGEPTPAIGNAGELRAALLAADAIYFPDPKLATAGIHFAKILAALGIADEVAARLRTYPNGATAMLALAASSDAHPIGCTQITEILAVDGLTLVGVLPKQFELATIYTAGAATLAAHPDAARRLAALLAAPEAEATRKQLGFGL
ncbi:MULTISPECIES: substrate-binding domain-containing protein [Rhodomicrobium]|uniref:molybdate ABC transporter substrate-binding protein n=1 Tax=Rhodomicrobium TaxID=1068 RepID=UPI000B4B6CE9|nr:MULTISPECIES: substrate-binding domain-containing protein [Rhodomicrobium]